MRLTVVGCSGSFPGPDAAASCYLVQADDVAGRTWSVLLDLGSGALGPLQRHLDPSDLDAVALSHLHPDHMADLCGLYVYRKYHPDRHHPVSGVRPEPSRLAVHGPVGTERRLEQAYGTEPGESLQDQLDVREWVPGTPVDVGPLRLTPVAVRHPVPAFGVRVSGPAEDDPARTVVLAYTGDTDACEGVVALAADADVLLSEAAFVEGRDDAVTGIHLTGRRAGQVATDARARRLLLTHLPSWNEKDVALAEARGTYAGPVEAVHAGLVVRL
ncbi:MBL fold metallo-hydrolase [Actinotalea sp. JY-7876]|uniref:MBL fold metallo-hydrolase n=1 Tax=Actinotalea sp. JY-7876 TaxID=2758442 RepID=UPI0015F6D441|nr:MBL fold metallo-hydrolase [Actinotalea sp. JY-7876]